MRTLIKNCTIISPNMKISSASIEIEDKRIKKIHREIKNITNVEIIYDAQGKIAAPGFIDIHVHGGAGFDTMNGSAEAIEKIAESKLEEGVTTFCPTTVTAPKENLIKSAKAVAEYKKSNHYAKVVGMHIEGPYINKSIMGAQNPKYLRKPDIEEISHLNEITDISIVSFAPEIEGGIEFTKQLINKNIVPSAGHSLATYKEYKDSKSAGIKHITHFCNCISKLHHRDIGLVGAGLLDDDIKLEIICDRIHLSPDMINLIFKNKTSDKIMLITDAMEATALQDGNYNIGGLEVQVKNGAARLMSNGALAGSTLRFYDALKNVSEITELPLEKLIQTTSYNQACSLGLQNTGKLEDGFNADIVILDKDLKPDAVFVDGVKRK